MRKVLLSTILWFIAVNVFAQIAKAEPTKYLIKYLETNTAQPDYSVTFLSDDEFIYKSPNTEKINTNSTKLSESNLFIATFEDKGDISDKREIKGMRMPTKKITKTGAAYSPDKETVYFSAKKYRKRPRRNDREQLFKANVGADGEWTNIEKLPFSNNRYSFGEPSLSGNGQQLYFTSDMPGGIGGADIYMVNISSNGEFGEPVNLGNRINTAGNEVTPYISKNNKLYFSSDNHIGGLGNLDVYCLDFNNPTTKPVHLDAPINGPNDDFAFIINSKGKRGYFSSNRLQGQNNHDIYSFLVEDVKKEGPCLQAITGIVKDNGTKEVIPNAVIILYDNDYNELESVKTDTDGAYSLTLDCNKTYTLTAGGKNYNTEDHIVNTANYLEAPTLEANKFLIKKSAEDIEVEETIIAKAADAKDVLEEKTKTADSIVDNINSDKEDEATVNAVYFGFDKAAITTKAARELDKLTDILKNNKSIHVELSSYTDSRGSSDYNQRLSERRAQASVDYLVAKGIDRSRITAKGYGESKMVNKCIDGIACSEAAHEKNRRTEFAFINSTVAVENYDNSASNAKAVIDKVKEQETVNEVVESSPYAEIKKTESVVENGVEETTNGIANKNVASSQVENQTENTVEETPAKLASNNTSNKKVETPSALSESNNQPKTEEELSDEAKRINSEIERLYGKKNDKKLNPTDTEIDEQLSDEAKWINSEIERLYGKDNAKKSDNHVIASTPKQEKQKEKFIFEKQNEQKSTTNSNTDPNRLLADIKAKKDAEQTDSAVSTTDNENTKKTAIAEKIPTVKKEALLSTSDVNVKAMQSKRGKYIETDRSKKVNALRVTFRVQPNGYAEKGYKDAYVVVKSPSGKIVNEKGKFPLADGKDQPYTDLTTIYYNGQSIKAVMFIDKIVHKFTKGVYTVNIFIDGVDVGENILTLS